MQAILTSRGARIQVLPAPEHLGNGMILRLSMQSAQDARVADVMLDCDNMLELGKALILESVNISERSKNTD